VSSEESEKLDSLAGDAAARYAEAIVEVDRSYGDLVLVVAKSACHDVLAWLKSDRGFNLLLDIAGVDCLKLPEKRERFEVEYVLYATKENVRARVRVPVPESDLKVPTVTDLWQSANWAEREAYEFFGVDFIGHPNLLRLLTHHEFEGHPLRKDYPVMQGQWCTTTSNLDAELNE